MQRLVQFKYVVLALVSKRKKGGLTQTGVLLKVNFLFGVIWTESSNNLLSFIMGE